MYLKTSLLNTISKKNVQIVVNLRRYADYLARKMYIPHQLLELNVGQNLAWNESLITAEFATELWYREEKYFVYNSKRYLAKTGNT